MMRLTCPECGKFLGEAEKNIDAKLFCRGCKELKDIKVRFAKAADYLPERKEIKDVN